MLGSSGSPNHQKPLRLRRVNHSDEIVSGFSKLLKTESMTDVTLICNGGQTIRAHRVILSTFSPYFKAIFEAQPFSNNPCQYPVIVIKDLALSELRAIVEFIYKGEVSVTRDKLSAVLHAAKALEVSGLSDLKVESNSLCSPSAAAVAAAVAAASTSNSFNSSNDSEFIGSTSGQPSSSSSSSSILASLTSGHPMTPYGSLNLSATAASPWKRPSSSSSSGHQHDSLISSSLFSSSGSSAENLIKKSRLSFDGNGNGNGFSDRLGLSLLGENGLNLSSAESIRSALSQPARLGTNGASLGSAYSGRSPTSQEILQHTLNQQLRSRNLTVEQFLAQKHQQRQLKHQAKLKSQQVASAAAVQQQHDQHQQQQQQIRQHILQQQLMKNGADNSTSSLGSKESSPSPGRDTPETGNKSSRTPSPKESSDDLKDDEEIRSPKKSDDKPEDMRKNVEEKSDEINNENNSGEGSSEKENESSNNNNEDQSEGEGDVSSEIDPENKPLQLTIKTNSGDDDESSKTANDTDTADGKENGASDKRKHENSEHDNGDSRSESGEAINGFQSDHDDTGDQGRRKVKREDVDMDEDPIIINTAVEDVDSYMDEDEMNGDQDDYDVEIAKDIIFQKQQQLRLQQLQRQQLYQLTQQQIHADQQHEAKLLEFYEQLQAAYPLQKCIPDQSGDDPSTISLDWKEGFMDDNYPQDRPHSALAASLAASQNRSALAMLVSNHNGLAMAAAAAASAGLTGHNGLNNHHHGSPQLSSSLKASSTVNNRDNFIHSNNHNSDSSSSATTTTTTSTTPLATPDFLQPRGPGRPRKGNKAQDISPCPECNKVFVRPDVLKLHYRSVHLNERHPCNMCPKIFKWPGDLSKHKRTKHPEALAAQAAANAAAAAAAAAAANSANNLTQTLIKS